MILGGGPADASNATGNTAIVDLTAPGPAYAPTAPMNLPRMHLNAVLLPDHTVFASGGTLSREDRTVARLQSEIYDPATNTWRIGATATVVRMYHLIALLLPRRPGRHRGRQVGACCPRSSPLLSVMSSVDSSCRN